MPDDLAHGRDAAGLDDAVDSKLEDSAGVNRPAVEGAKALRHIGRFARGAQSARSSFSRMALALLASAADFSSLRLWSSFSFNLAAASCLVLYAAFWSGVAAGSCSALSRQVASSPTMPDEKVSLLRLL